MSKDKKNGRPISKNVDYFPHKCKDDKELRFIQHKYKSEGYEVFYRLQQCLGDAEFHRIDLGNDLEKQMFEMSMSVNQEIVYGVIDILVELNWLDKELYQKEKVLWSDKFMDSIRAVYINRIRKDPSRKIPTKKDIYRVSTCRNESIVEYSIEEDSKEEKREEKDDSLLSVEQYEELFPDKNVDKSFKKYLEYDKNPTHTKAMGWLDRGMNTKPKKFRKSSNGDFIAYCSKCGGKQFPDKFQVKQLSTCCRVEYLPTNPYNNSVNQLQSKEMINEN